MRTTLLLAALCGLPLSVLAQPSPAGSSWQRVQQLPPQTRLHIAADKNSRVCLLTSVTDDSLVCTKKGKPAFTFSRAEIKSIKLTRYGVSTLAGAGIGAGAGAVIGFAAIRPRPNATIDFPNIERAIFAVSGGIVGAALGGPTDFLRGPTIYVRP